MTSLSAAAALLCVGLFLPRPAAADEDVVELKRAVEELRATNRELRKRIEALEAEKPNAEHAPPTAPAAAAPAAEPKGAVAEKPADKNKTEVEQRTQELEQRIKELEVTKTAQESATRSIIQNALSKTGSKINQFVTLGGAIETIVARAKDFTTGQRNESISLGTAEMDFEARPSEWALGNLIVGGVDQLNVSRATLTIGDLQRFPIYVKAGRDVLPFGISTGVHRIDLVSLNDPLTIDAFETRRNAIGIGFALPTPPAAPPPKPQIVPPSRPLVVSPLISSLSESMGYAPLPVRRTPPTPVTLPPEPPPFYGDLYFYDANSVRGVTRKLGSSISGRLGYRTSRHCGRTYSELVHSNICPWTADLSVDYISSVFDSDFLQSEYRQFIPQIGRTPGLAPSLKVGFGPYSFIYEMNGATKPARFIDGAGRSITIRPSAWQVSLARQFDWNPWLESIGSQGTYVALSYSKTHDLQGVLNDDPQIRIAFAPEARLILTAAEWVVEGVRLALEYSRNRDYPTSKGGTGRQAEEIQFALMLTW